MKRSWTVGAAVLATGAIGALPGLVGAGSAVAATAGQTTLAGSAPAAAVGPSTGTVAGTQTLTIQVWLTPNLAGATQFANAVSTPGSAQYHQYLSPAAYTARFGATAAQAQAVQSWLTSEGLSQVSTSAQRDYVSATGSVAAINQAFGIVMKQYQVATAVGKTETIQTNDRALSVPSSLSGDVMSVSGLNSTRPTTEHTTPIKTSAASSTDCSGYWGQLVKTLNPPYGGLTQSPYAVCGYSASQLRAAYGQTNANTGVGQTIALIEIGQPTAMFQTLTDYAASNGLPAPASDQFRQEIIGQGGACGNEFDVEEQLDSEAAYAMAPGATQLMVEGDSCNEQLEGVQPLFDADLAVLTGNGSSSSASIVSNSWELGGENFPSIYITTAHAIDLRAAAEGVGMYFSSGDGPGVESPSSDPYSTAVGGTTLGVGATNNRLFETGWSDDYLIKEGGSWVDQGIDGAAGGGPSLLYSQPSWQQGVVPASMSTTPAGAVDRAVPDISADADPFSGMLIGIIEPNANGQPGPYETEDVGGTSEASPLVAGMVADAQQGQSTSFGFINPLLYSAANSNAYNQTLPVTASTPQLDRSAFAPIKLVGVPLLVTLDAQGPAFAEYTDQVTAPGYDTMTGLGTPHGSAFIKALRSGS
jgi:subtilase family serine protease